MTNSVHDRLRKADHDLAQAKARRQRLVNTIRAQEQKAQKRREHLAGSAALELLQTDDVFRSRFLPVLDRRLKRRSERALFGLSPKPGDEADAPEPERNSELDGCQPSGNNA